MTKSEINIWSAFDTTTLVYCVLLLVATCLVAFMVYENCKPKDTILHESFDDNSIQYVNDEKITNNKNEIIIDYNRSIIQHRVEICRCIYTFVY